ncbi:lipopolysaccharide biosynthesis protein [Pedobacter yonginense]|uniref:Lipopolysaccharide biosynthesis protein n=1 Tax=Pedobacter yonginense TaxID=651869 RepID=A0A317ES43_9SPHI|nr:lipopolysaccharide biosynthesis protein [Pedobacter yonginense]PWS29225.1 lipopolysaccharide biosynthesis protein [Pedobacter yonginense]
MDIKSFLKLVNKYKWVLILVPIIAVTITYFLVQKLPKQYASEVQISTGILDPSKKVISTENVDFFKVSQQFSSIMEKFRMKKIINILSYNLILHDLEQPKKTFRPYSKKIDSLNATAKQEVIQVLKEKLATKSILTLGDNKGKYKLYDIVGSMGYGEEDLLKKLSVTHADNSDYINVEFISEDPDLSAYVVNTLASEFISNYSADVNINQTNSIVLLDSLLKAKELVMNEKNTALSSFKRNKGVLNLNEQSATVYGQISQYEAQRTDAIRQMQSNQGAIATIEAKLRGSDAFIGGSSRADNREIINLKRQLKIASDAYVDGGFKASDQKKIDSLNRIISSRSADNEDQNVLDPRASKQALVQQKINLEIAMQQAKSSLNSINSELSVLRARYSSMVPFDADISNYERDADLATKDYTAALEQYNQSKTDQNLGLHLQIEEPGLPGNPLPSKKILYLAGSGIGSFALCLSALFLLFMSDSSITTVQQLEKLTKSKSIGILNKIEGDERNIRDIWNDKSDNLNYEVYRDLLRSIRFEITKQLEKDDSKIVGITSLGSGEGKTLVGYSLAYAFAAIGKKVLLIADELPVVQAQSKQLATNQNFQTFLIKKQIQTEDLITVMNKNTARSSLLESQSMESLKGGFEVLRKEFDIILVDVNSLRDINIAKEWLLFTEKNIAVFESGKSMASTDMKLVEYVKELPDFSGWILNKVANSK